VPKVSKHVADMAGAGLFKRLAGDLFGYVEHQADDVAERAARQAPDVRSGAVTPAGSATSSAGQPPTVAFSRDRAPGIADNFDDAVANGKPTTLTRAGTRTAKDNRRAALKGQEAAPAGQSLDEYPFASSVEGGSGAFVRAVPVGEQNYQGGTLSAFYKKYGIEPGDQYVVRFDP